MPRDAVPWLRGIVVWVLIILAESVHGTLRQLFLAPAIGDFHARQAAVFSGIALVFLIAVLTIRWVAVRNFAESLLVGALWVALTVAFEVALGRAILGYDWSRILEDYDMSRGGLMGPGLLAMLFTPAAAARIRRRQLQR